MSLTALQIRAFSPGATAYKRADERGLYLEIFPNGSKLWRLKYYVGGKEKRIALGAWPEVSLQAARLRVAMRSAQQVLRPFIDMSQVFRSGLMATAMGSAASPIIDDYRGFQLLFNRQEFRQRCAALRFNKGDISARR